MITRSATFTRRLAVLPSPEGSKQAGGETIPVLHAPVMVRGNNITVDFGGSTLQGSPQTVEPDQRKGLGIEVSGNDVTIENLHVRGYKVGLLARGCKRLRLLNCDFSYNWKQHLHSTLEKEDESDWQSYHHNENDEWLRYGAGIYLRGCDHFEVKGCKVQGGQCGLMLTQCDNGLVWNNDFSFNSGLGIGMYRSSSNRIMHNKVDWDVRGFSYGVYNRGQDSAGILIFEQSSHNVFAFNSVTHGGDGFFLWAGQTTMDTGQGGCNDNLVCGNDFSHAPTNGIEATFSRNSFLGNKVLDCWHGMWGGYSWDSAVTKNVFGFNDEAIAWEHGQNDSIVQNTFYRDNVGVHIWANPGEDPNWVYAKKRDTRSHDWSLADNHFDNEFTRALDIQQSDTVLLYGNQIDHSGESLRVGEKVSGLVNDSSIVSPGKPLPTASSLNPGPVVSPAEYVARFDEVPWDPYAMFATGTVSTVEARLSPDKSTVLFGSDILELAERPLPGGQNAFLPKGTLRGWRYILIDQWGPYDFKRPLLWPRGDLPNGKKRFEILGPKGKWRLAHTVNVGKVSAKSGQVPGYIDVDLPKGKAGKTEIAMEYVGKATTDYRGIVTPAGKAVKFAYSRFFAPIDWKVRFYRWSKSANPADPHAAPDENALQQAEAHSPVQSLSTDRLDFAGSAFTRELPNDHYATVAEGSFTVSPGDYKLELTTDDGARVWVDGKKVIDAWHYQGPTEYTANLRLGGRHPIRVEHFQIDGYAALKLDLKPRE